jgi:IclR family transcriptional regulator, pca regulon regulatory protein
VWLLSTHVPSGEIDPKDLIAGLEKGLVVLALYSESRSRLTIADAARGALISRAAARRVLLTLVHTGYVATDGKFFTPTPRVLRLARGYLEAQSIPERVQPLLDAIMRQTGESSSAAILDGDEIVYVARSATRRIMSVGLGVGSRLPAHATSMGRALLAFLPPADLDAFCKRAPFPRLTSRTITDADGMRRELIRVRERGYALVDEELELGLRSIAVPVLEPSGLPVVAINISVAAAQMSALDMREKLLPVLLSTVKGLG